MSALGVYDSVINNGAREMTKTIQTAKTSAGQLVRIQQRGKSFDVIRNSTGYCWMYVLKAVSEQRARNEFFLLTVAA